jgi:predicted AlkP superfamily pyrophosphatase or phosphodiesterase
MDDVTLQFALDGVRALELGADRNRTDILAVSLSTLDAVGHRYGPDSREVHDHMLRVDQYLDTFIDSLLALRGAGNVLIALTADHGVTPFPEVRSTLYPNSRAARVSLDEAWDALIKRLADRDIDTTALVRDEGLVVVTKPNAFGAGSKSADALLGSFAADVRRIHGVLRADLMTDLARADTTRDTIARRWLHMFAPTSNVRLIVTLTPYSNWWDYLNAAHGSPHDSDAQVPVAFWGPAIRPGQHNDVVRVVDIAPTLAAILGVRPLEPLDGVVLTKVLR